jgi:purine-nucleoside phosphorylase
MLIRDHINLLGGSPLEGANDGSLGPRFVDMSTAYSAAFRAAARAASKELALVVREGVYAAVRGPQYETPAEVRMLAMLGADAVGMSTVPEVIVAAHMGVPVLGLSLLSNLAAGLGSGSIDHDEVLATGARRGPALAELVRRVLPVLAGGRTA